MIRRALNLLPSLAVSLLLVTPATADPGAKWTRINREAGITVYSKTVKGSDLVAVKGETTIKQPLDRVLSVLMTHERWGEWVDSMKGSKILKTVSKYEYIVYQSFELPVEALQLTFLPTFQQGGHHPGGRVEADLASLLTCSEGDGAGKVRLPGAAVADHEHVLTLVDMLRADQFAHTRLVDRGLLLEVETVEAFRGWKLRRLDPPFDHPALALDQLQLAKPQQILHMILALRRALAGQLAIFALEGRQSQRLEVMLQ